MKIHTAYSYEHARKITDALEALNRDYQLEREKQPIEYVDHAKFGRIPKPPRIIYIIKEV